VKGIEAQSQEHRVSDFADVNRDRRSVDRSHKEEGDDEKAICLWDPILEANRGTEPVDSLLNETL